MDPGLLFDLTIDPIATGNETTGAATLTGTVACANAGATYVDIYAIKPQETPVSSYHHDETISFSGADTHRRAWSAELNLDGFRPGTIDVNLYATLFR